MTDDTHGSEPHDPEAEANLEQEPAPAAGGETWRGGVDDDFSDPAAAEMTPAPEGEGEAQSLEGEEDAGQVVEQTPRKRGILPIVIVTVGGLIVLGVLGYWQFGDSLRGEAPAPLTNSAMPSPKPMAEDSKHPASVAVAATKPGPSAVLPADGVSPKTDMIPPSPAPVAPAPTALQPPPVPPAPVNVPVAPPSPMITEVTIPPAATSPSAPNFAASPVAPGVSIKTDNDVDARVKTLSLHIEELQKALEQTTTQLGQISTRLNDMAQKPSSLDERLSALEQKMLQMQVEHNGRAPAEAMPAPAVKAAKPVTHHVAAAQPVSHPKAKKPVTVAHAESASWVLRAASPDEAWIAANNITSELRPVHVGDNVPGIGRVTAIREEGGNWVVYGSKGTIH